MRVLDRIFLFRFNKYMIKVFCLIFFFLFVLKFDFKNMIMN